MLKQSWLQKLRLNWRFSFFSVDWLKWIKKRYNIFYLHYLYIIYNLFIYFLNPSCKLAENLKSKLDPNAGLYVYKL